ncbi:MAG: COP23 domain-containing protein [Cyanobacteria bacterium P01_D01_bin.1]
MSNTHKSNSRNYLRRPLLTAGMLLGAIATVASPTFAQTSPPPLPDVEPESQETPTPTSDPRFECQFIDGEYTVMYLPENQPGRAYKWATPTRMGGGWTAERRCFAISDRLESYRPEGLAELQVGMENGYDIVCATTEQSPGACKIVFTVPRGQNPVITRDRVFDNLTIADAGTETTVVTTFTGTENNDLLSELGSIIGDFPIGSQSPNPTSNGINLKPFLSPADGGTGTALNAPAAPSRSLNPDNFR